jgi:hypothetical protein
MELNNKRNKLVMIGGVNPKILVSMNENGDLIMDEEMARLLNAKPNWKLVREHDGLTKQSVAIKWLEWNEMGRFKASHETPAIGLSLIMSPFNEAFTWQTTTIVELVESTPEYVKFKTENSNYELFKL